MNTTSSGMAMEDVFATYVDALRSVVGASSVFVRAPDDCVRMMNSLVKLPVQLPITYGTLDKFVPLRDEIYRSISVYARERGIQEVNVPYLSRCRTYFRKVKASLLGIAVGGTIVGNRYVGNIGSYVIIAFEPRMAPHRRFPLAWWGRYATTEYVESLSVVYLTALFFNRNPWVADVVRSVLEKTNSEFAEAFTEITTLYSALRFLDTEGQ